MHRTPCETPRQKRNIAETCLAKPPCTETQRDTHLRVCLGVSLGFEEKRPGPGAAAWTGDHAPADAGGEPRPASPYSTGQTPEGVGRIKTSGDAGTKPVRHLNFYVRKMGLTENAGSDARKKPKLQRFSECKFPYIYRTGQNSSIKKGLRNDRNPLILAEKEGFEPSMGVKAHTPLAGERLQPLGHFSGYFLLQHDPPITRARRA